MIQLALLLIALSATPAFAVPPNGNVRVMSATVFEFNREEILAQLADERRHSCGWVVPHYIGDRYRGFRIVGLRPGTTFSALGLHHRDVIKAVSGVEINSPDRTLRLWDAMSNETNFSVTVERAGRLITFEYRAD